MSVVIKGAAGRCLLTVLRCVVPILALGRHVQTVLYHREMDHAIEKSTMAGNNGGQTSNNIFNEFNEGVLDFNQVETS